MGLLEPHGRGRRLFRRNALSEAAPVIIVHSRAQAVAAVSAAAEAGSAIVLLSPPDAGIYAGPGWFREVMHAAREAVPEARFTAILDCGEDAGAAMAAMRAGLQTVVFTGPAELATRLADIAAQAGAQLLREGPAAILDLGTSFFANDAELRCICADALASKAAFC
jgi:hypothetical protein